LQLNGIFILSELPEEIAKRVREINERYDPKLAKYRPPHITLTGSS
jgi:2'-5' RNA ligase